MNSTLKSLFRLESRPSFTIKKNGSPYLTRWWLSSRSEESYHARKHVPVVLLHRIWRPDGDRDPHSHPWWFLSFVLKGSYVENRYDKSGIFTHQVKRGRFSLGFRPAITLHDISEVSPDLWTLLLVGPKRHEWGFMTNAGMVHWTAYGDAGETSTSSTPPSL